VAEQKWLQTLFRKVLRDGAEVTSSGNLLQMREAAAGNALSPTVDSRVGHKRLNPSQLIAKLIWSQK